jgi:hypothetical protein
MTNNIKAFPKTQSVDRYRMVNVLYCPTDLKTTTDFTTATQRNKKWGIIVNLNIVPSLDKYPINSPVIFENMPSEFFTGDSLEELRQQLVDKIDEAMKYAKMSVEEPEKFEALMKERISNMT